MNIFLSHISEESSVAKAIKVSLESALPGVEVFVSASDIESGQQWLKAIDGKMESANMILTLCSPASVRMPWVNFESGSGWARRLPVIPIYYKGLTQEQVPDPLRIFQGINLTSSEACKKLVDEIAAKFKIKIVEGFEPKLMYESLKPNRVAKTEGIGIVRAHRQGEWKQFKPTVFNLVGKLPAGLSGDWQLNNVNDKADFLSENLNKYTGLIFASPWRSKLEPEIISTTVEWVKQGGRLLLLGFELGDRHHDANLAELSHHFGISPSVDIVGPPGFGDQKPYDTVVDFDILDAEEHPFNHKLKNIQLTNVQTLRVEPGGIEWLRVGKNIVYQVKRETVFYRDGTMTAPGGSAFHLNNKAGWLPIAVEAPKGLCGQGGVQMIGTWDLLGTGKQFSGDNLKLVSRILDWLSGKNI